MEDGSKFGQTRAIMHYLGAIYGYIPQDPKTLLICEQLSEDYCDVVADIVPPTFKPAGEEKEKGMDKCLNDVLPKSLAKIENSLGNKKFLCGESLTLADFYWGCLYTSWLTNPMAYEPERREALLKQFPRYTAYGKKF